MKNKTLFYVLSLTWGLPMTLIGAVCALFLILTNHKPKRHGGCIYFSVCENWGGLELGLFFIVDKNESEHTKNHEFGHAIQNCKYGFLMPFIVCIPSAIRYHYRNWRTKRGLTNATDYDDIWFEREATELGYAYEPYWR